MTVTIDDALLSQHLLAPGLGPLETWSTWRTALKAAFGLSLTTEELVTFHSIAGERDLPPARVQELWCILGRRSGKSRMAAAVASYLAAFADKSLLSPGEVGTVLVLAASKLQARTVFQYVKGFFESSPTLQQLVQGSTSDELRLRGGISIAVHPNSYRTVRGRTLLACVFDEVAFWRSDESAVPDMETYRAVLPALGTTNGLLIGISSPYRKTGLLHQKHKDYYGVSDPDVLVIQAGTSVFNPTLDGSVIERARVSDPESALAEWDAQFRTDIGAFVTQEAVEACIEPGVRERAPDRRNSYVAFVDASGGSKDSMTLAISHREGKTNILDATREVKPPFSPESVVLEFADLLRKYRCSQVTGDRYGGDWVAERFKEAGIFFEHADRSKSQLYIDLLPMINSQSVDLLDDERLVTQLVSLERRTSRTGRDLIDHPPGGHDDLANAVAGALVLADTEPSFAPKWPEPQYAKGLV